MGAAEELAEDAPAGLEGLGARLRAARRAHGYTQADLALEAELGAGGQQLVARYEGGRSVPSLTIAARIAAVLGVSLDWLATGSA